jgi:hypothetical protein
MQVRFAVVAGLAFLAFLTSRLEYAQKPLVWAPWIGALLLPFWLMPGPAKVQNYPDLNHPEIDRAADWARANTPKDAVFLLPDADKALTPGFFRVRSLRSVYVDWKGGGQVNLLKEFATEWWDRWQKSGEGKFDPTKVDQLAGLGIDYIVVEPDNRLRNREPAYQNGNYLVYRLRP